MRDMNLDWCYEGGCTYMKDTDTMIGDEQDTGELAAVNREPCIGMYD
jgi:hypothetical protein